MASPARSTVSAQVPNSLHKPSSKDLKPAANPPPSTTNKDVKVVPQSSSSSDNNTRKSSSTPAKSAPDPEANDADDDDDDAPPIDLETFEQIMELDEDDTHDFSRAMTWQYFSQVGTTFTKMEEALSAENLNELSDLGHFLKGSSAALGVAKVQDSCERMQHYGHLRDEERGVDITKKEALKLIRGCLTKAKKDYVEAEAWLKDWFEKNAVDE
ncbi:signal transduction histidine kinase [Pterulicium gracile]|uniref:Signal transduction histidine kinase n=1 Tax=Pterulicium gracile TaxID=1884261 RepID=A0A5C3Q8S7_9AGAR|nr:signal transduction histidine kinase [Pterula gracilis]